MHPVERIFLLLKQADNNYELFLALQEQAYTMAEQVQPWDRNEFPERDDWVDSLEMLAEQILDRMMHAQEYQYLRDQYSPHTSGEPTVHEENNVPTYPPGTLYNDETGFTTGEPMSIEDCFKKLDWTPEQYGKSTDTSKLQTRLNNWTTLEPSFRKRPPVRTKQYSPIGVVKPDEGEGAKLIDSTFKPRGILAGHVHDRSYGTDKTPAPMQGIGGHVDSDIRNQGYYTRLYNKVLQSGQNIVSDDRNHNSAPFHRKYLSNLPPGVSAQHPSKKNKIDDIREQLIEDGADLRNITDSDIAYTYPLPENLINLRHNDTITYTQNDELKGHEGFGGLDRWDTHGLPDITSLNRPETFNNNSQYNERRKDADKLNHKRFKDSYDGTAEEAEQEFPPDFGPFYREHFLEQRKLGDPKFLEEYGFGFQEE